MQKAQNQAGPTLELVLSIPQSRVVPVTQKGATPSKPLQRHTPTLLPTLLCDLSRMDTPTPFSTSDANSHFSGANTGFKKGKLAHLSSFGCEMSWEGRRSRHRCPPVQGAGLWSSGSDSDFLLEKHSCFIDLGV